jgi:hypothetical protein
MIDPVIHPNPCAAWQQVDEETVNQTTPHHSSEIRKLGKVALKIWEEIRSLLDFTGQTVLSLARFLTGKARVNAMNQCLERLARQITNQSN